MMPLGQNVVPLFPKIRFGLAPEQEKQLMDMAEKMRNGLKMIRSDYESDWKELSSYFAPHLCRIDDTTKTRKNKW